MTRGSVAVDPTAHVTDVNAQVIDNVDVGIFILDRRFRVRRWNRWLLSRTRISEQAILDQDIFRFFPELVTRGLDRYYHEVLSTRAIRVLSPAFHGFLLPMRPTRPIEGIETMQQLVKIIPLTETGGEVTGILTSIEDVTENVYSERELVRSMETLEAFSRNLEQQVAEKTKDLALAQEQLVKSEKLSAIGEIISGVAHEINNPLAVIMGYAQLLVGMTQGTRASRDLEKIATEAKRCRQIVLNLLNFVREHKTEKGPTDVNALIRDTLSLREYQIRVDRVKVVQRLAPRLPLTLANVNQIQQVLLNIINNAQHAMQSVDGRRQLTVTSEVDEGMIRITLRDTGPGIPGDHLARVFEPFFTTKVAGKGTGLGLSVSANIISDHGGRISARNEHGGGATFVIELPVLPGARIPATPMRPEVGEDAPTYRILVVDDEPLVAEVTTRILQNAGHRVDTALGAEAAILRLERRRYDLILTDLRMGGVDGREFHEMASRHDPGLAQRFIFVTGDALNEATARFLESAGNAFVRKPFTVDELLRIVHVTGNRLLAPSPTQGRHR